MPTNYTPDSTAAQPPSPAPNGENPPILVLPADGDALNASAWMQAFKVLGDWVVWLVTLIWPLKGVRTHNANWPYGPGDMVMELYGGKYLTYKCKGSNINIAPHNNPDKWDRWGHTPEEVQEEAGKYASALTGITASNGATVSNTHMVAVNHGAYKSIDFQVHSVPADSYTDIDLSGSDTALETVARVGHATMNSSSWAYGGAVGVMINRDGDPNHLRVWWKRASGDPIGVAEVSVSIMGH